jgi:hypothetical protein
VTFNTKVVRAAAVLALSLSYLAYVFHLVSRRFWTYGIGDWLDPSFINYLLEHWRHSLAHLNDPSSPPMYFPARHTLGYSHSLILYVPFYIAMRAFANPLIADNLTVFLVIECGIICLYLLLRKFVNLSAIEAIALTAFFCTSQNLINGATSAWAQRATVFLIPPIILLTLVAWTRRNPLLAFVAGLLAALLLPQDFPSALFAFLLLALFVAPVLLFSNARLDAKVALVLAALALAWTVYVTRFGGINVRLLGIKIASDRWEKPAAIAIVLLVYVVVRNNYKMLIRPAAIAFIVGAIAGVSIFLAIYLPAFREHSSFPHQQVVERLQQRDLMHVNVYDSPRPFLFAIAIVVMAWIPYFKIDGSGRVYALLLAIASLFALIAPVRLGNFSIWMTLFEPIPGLGAVRDPARVIHPYELALVLIAALLMMRHATNRAFRNVITTIALLLIVTYWNRDTFEFKRPVAAYEQWVDAPISIDGRCRSFFIKGASDSYIVRADHMWSLYGMDSAFIATKYSIPTLNGYSAWWPTDWNLANPQEADYMRRVDDWIRRNKLTGVCALDIDQRTMRPYRP